MIPIKAPSRQAPTLVDLVTEIRAGRDETIAAFYEVALTGGPAGYATLSTEGVPALSSAPPKEFDGPGDAWSPEHLLLASVLACFMFTFRAVARGSNFDFLSLDLTGSGTVDRKDGVTRFTEIVSSPGSCCRRASDPDRANRVLEKGKTACLVTASLPSRFASRRKFSLRLGSEICALGAPSC